MRPIAVAEHVTLAPLQIEDAGELFRLTDANRDYLRRWLPWLDSIKRVTHTRAFIQAARSYSESRKGLQLAIRRHDRIAGIVGYHPIEWRNRLTSLGYWVGEDYQGLGLVTASCRALLTHAFNDVRLNRVEIRCAVANHRSRAVPTRLGFRQEGLLRDAEWLYDRFVDHVVYAMLAREWPQAAVRPLAATTAAGPKGGGPRQ